MYDLNYEYILRLDDDSFILSDIKYNIFEFMQSNHLIYGYRICSFEMKDIFKYDMLINYFNKYRTDNKTTFFKEYDEMTYSYNLCGFYNNFFIANVSYFKLNSNIQQFINYILDMQFIYLYRLGDLQIHTAALRLHVPTDKIHRFVDWTYQHFSINYINELNVTCPIWGCLQQGVNDKYYYKILNKHLNKYFKCPSKYKYCHIKQFRNQTIKQIRHYSHLNHYLPNNTQQQDDAIYIHSVSAGCHYVK
eukprot:106310_1